MKARAALLVAAAALLAGCGVPSTGVVEAGEPAVGMHTRVTLYFVRVQDGSLATVLRRTDNRVDAAGAVAMLLTGLAEVEEKKMGLTTALPPADTPTVRTDGDTVTVDLRTPADGLSGTAVDQVVCTVRAAGGSDAPTQVTVTVNGTPTPPALGGNACARARLWPEGPPQPAGPVIDR